MNTTLIKLFNAALHEDLLSFQTVNIKAARLGYLIHPMACTNSVMQFLDEQTINPNATFYKDLEDVISKSRLELFIDQVYHYCSTYGTDFSEGNGYVPNDGAENESYNFEHYKVIMPISEAELYNRCLEMLCSGVALKQSTMHAVADYIIDYYSKSNDKNILNIDTIANREALIYICDKLGICPNDKFSLFRYIIYKTTGSEMIIKNADTIQAIKNSYNQFDFSVLSSDQMKTLASIFLRYKDLFLAFKHANHSATDNAPYINKLRKMAVKLHEPMKVSFWQTIFSDPKDPNDIQEHLNEITNFKKISLMQACLERLNNTDNQLYIVRNQKMFLRNDYKTKCDRTYLSIVYTLLMFSITESLKEKSSKLVPETAEDGTITYHCVPKKVRLASGLSVALPSSEKSFIGNYPFGTSYDMKKHNFIGCYWRNEWGTNDFDLSLSDISGHKFGWNGIYNSGDRSVIYSGDMTNANPEAAEILYMAEDAPKGIVKVNQYNGAAISKFQLFVGQTDKGIDLHNKIGHIVDPDCIKLQFEVPINNQREIAVGITTGEKLVLMSVQTGNLRVSRSEEYDKQLMDAFILKSKCFVDAETMLKIAKFDIVDESYSGEVDIDFNNLDKDSLISLLK